MDSEVEVSMPEPIREVKGGKKAGWPEGEIGLSLNRGLRGALKLLIQWSLDAPGKEP